MNKRKILNILTIIQIIALLVVSSYSWFSDKNNPTISESDIQVSAAEGLVIKLEPDSEARTEVSLNEIMDSYNLFELKQVSSADAEDFYYIDFGQGLSQGDPQFVQVDYELDGSLDMVKYGYIDYNFYLETENFPKHVYIHKDTGFTGDGADSFRVAISYTQDEVTTTHIFGNTAENGSPNAFTTEAVVAAGYFEYNDIDPMYLDNQMVKLFADYNGGRGTDDNAFIDLNKVLVDIPANTQITVNVKMWLEGGDVDCDATIANTLMDVVLKFGSANILLDAPSVTPNNSNYTINNLTTAMEYSSTYTPTSVWTAVTNPSMTFGTGQTVYVRIAEVTNESPASYATTVTFS